MASSLSSQKFESKNKVLMFKHAPGDTSNNYTSWVDFKQFGNILIGYLRITGTGALSSFKIYAATDSSGTDATEIKVSSANADAVGDYCFLEAIQAELALDPTKNFTHISARIQLATGSDVGAVVYVLGEPRFAYRDLTSDSIA